MASEPIVAELRAAGFPVRWISDLRRQKLDYGRAIPILLRWLPKVEHLGVKEEIVRTLSVRWARPMAAPALIEEFRAVPDASGLGLKWAIGNGLEVVADDRVFDDLLALVLDRRHGRAREMIVLALGRMKDPRAVDVLIHLLEDDDLVGHAAKALGKVKNGAARPHLERLLTHPRAWVRNEVKRAIAQIDRASSRPASAESSGRDRSTMGPRRHTGAAPATPVTQSTVD